MLKTRNLKLIFIFVALLGSPAIFAQVQAPVQASPAAAENVSDADLQKFAEAYIGIQQENQKAQQQMAAKIEESGLELNRFNEIHKASMDPNTEVEATDDELAKHKAAVGELEKMQPALEAKMQGIIKDSGLTMEKYQAVAMSIQSNKDLQQKLQGILMKMTQQG
ncbi:DUF4168 domain-containing protein [Galbibacter mesophilus]|uniref:DUF4168 domain-containing protein n=1 Tax=Galbibacter mesophilus TaxID=379069 RepID=UPI0019203228|nr:DUF4168 domain-containing protein [Galbibacter mesophilus]MCM5662224.1 DUF4168 domain-containing protein [Galbibacter mesophilus]